MIKSSISIYDLYEAGITYGSQEVLNYTIPNIVKNRTMNISEWCVRVSVCVKEGPWCEYDIHNQATNDQWTYFNDFVKDMNEFFLFLKT